MEPIPILGCTLGYIYMCIFFNERPILEIQLPLWSAEGGTPLFLQGLFRKGEMGVNDVLHLPKAVVLSPAPGDVSLKCMSWELNHDPGLIHIV